MEADRNKCCCTCKSFVSGKCHLDPPRKGTAYSFGMELPEFRVECEKTHAIVKPYGTIRCMFTMDGGWPSVEDNWWCSKWNDGKAGQ